MVTPVCLTVVATWVPTVVAIVRQKPIRGEK